MVNSCQRYDYVLANQKRAPAYHLPEKVDIFVKPIGEEKEVKRTTVGLTGSEGHFPTIGLVGLETMKLHINDEFDQISVPERVLVSRRSGDGSGIMRNMNPEVCVEIINDKKGRLVNKYKL